MNKLLLNLAFCFISVFAYGQPASWVGPKFKWVYDFGSSTEPVQKVASGNNLNLVSTADTRTFLPSPISGSALARSASDGTPIFTLMNNGLNDTIKIQASSTGNPGKISLFNVAGATAATSIYFTLNFESNAATGGDFKVAVGNYDGDANIFTNSSGVGNTDNTTSRPEIFGGLRWAISGNEMTGSYRVKADAASATAFNPINYTFNRGTNYQIEMLCNNTSTNQTYNKSEVVHTLPTRTYHLWSNGTQLE